MQYDTGKHCVFYHRYHLVWSTKYRYKVLTGDLGNVPIFVETRLSGAA